MTPEDVKLRPCQPGDLSSVVEIYHEAFQPELSFFFKRFPRRFFEAVFCLLVKDTIVAESQYDVVGFVTVTSGLGPMTGTRMIRLVLKLPKLLASTRSSLFMYLLQKLRNSDWSEPLLGIACIAVRTRWRSKGIGRTLMRQALARYPDMNAILDVRPWNRSAIRLYTSVGFRRTAVWGDPFGGWVVMRRAKGL